MAANKTKTPQQSTALRLEIYRRYCSGQTQAAIAAALGMHLSNVGYHITKARAAIQCEIAHHRADRLRELDHLRSEAWTAWEQDRTAQAAVFLNQVQQSIKQERALLGLDALKSVSAQVTFEGLPSDTEDSVVSGLQES